MEDILQEIQDALNHVQTNMNRFCPTIGVNSVILVSYELTINYIKVSTRTVEENDVTVTGKGLTVDTSTGEISFNNSFTMKNIFTNGTIDSPDDNVIKDVTSGEWNDAVDTAYQQFIEG